MQLFKENKIRIQRACVGVVLVLYLCFTMLLGYSDYLIPDRITVTQSSVDDGTINVSSYGDKVYADASLFGTVPLKQVEVTVIEDNKLIPCGNVFGVKFYTKGVLVVRLAKIETKDGNISPAKESGLMVEDVITSVNGVEINTVEEMASCVENCRGKEMNIIFIRDGKKLSCVLKPALSLTDKKYKTGIWVRDSTAGIGTMTYYNPSTGSFAGLGHGICDVDTGCLMPLLRGNVVDVVLTDVIKGKKGLPGELKGDFDSEKIGVITENTEKGVYGVMSENNGLFTSDGVEIALKNEVQTGQAELLCEVDGEGVKAYKIEIVKIDKNEEVTKNFTVKVTDKQLISKTGGIVQGMSGSPIIQNGKLIGAVTHVFVNDPTRGYGIFIENMLAEAEKIK